MTERKYIYFASDAHLGLNVVENPIDSERRIVRWLDSIKAKAKAIYLLGDMFDYWFEYRSVVPKGYVRFLGKLAELADEGVELYIFTGNHDIWMFDYLQKTIGATVIRDNYETEIYGKKFFMAHGDGLGDPSKSFKFLRCFFRNKTCQWLYKLIHPDLTVPFGFAWSRYNRKRKLGNKAEKYLGEKKEYLVQFAKEHEKENSVDYYMFGHRHILLDIMISKSSRVMILGDWIWHFSYAVFDGENMTLEQFEI